VLLYLTGSSCSGKTTIAFAAARRFPDLAVHDVDEDGAPRDAASEFWVRRALEYQQHGIAVCLVDVADRERRERLAQREPGKWDLSAVDAFVGWAAWHRWTGWAAGDPRWFTHLLDTTDRPIDQSVAQIEAWIASRRSAHSAGLLPLQRGWDIT